jgi:hypothetical protein
LVAERRGPMQETLIVVHLCSIDSYISFYGVEAAIKMATDLKAAIIIHPGPVVIMDQEWKEISEDARVLRASVLELERSRPLHLFHHDELLDISPWQDGMKKLASVLRALKTSRVRLGGFWASESGETGCVHEVQRQLRARNIPCYLDKGTCALEENDPRVRVP